REVEMLLIPSLCIPTANGGEGAENPAGGENAFSQLFTQSLAGLEPSQALLTPSLELEGGPRSLGEAFASLEKPEEASGDRKEAAVFGTLDPSWIAPSLIASSEPLVGSSSEKESPRIEMLAPETIEIPESDGEPGPIPATVDRLEREFQAKVVDLEV